MDFQKIRKSIWLPFPQSSCFALHLFFSPQWQLETRSNEKFSASVIEIKVVIEILRGQGEIAPVSLFLPFSLFQATPTSLRAILSTDHVPSGWDWAAKVFLKWATCERLSCSWLAPLLPPLPLYVRPFSFSLYCHRWASVKFIRETETESTAMRPTGFTVSP